MKKITIFMMALFMLSATSTQADLVGRWSFDGDALDSSGYGNDGTVYGATYVPGFFDQALSFDGSDDYVDCGSDSSLSFSNTTPLTFEAWVYNELDIPSPSSTYNLRIILERSTAWANGYAFQYGQYLYGSYPGYIVWAGFYSGREGFTNYQILANQWYHLAAVYNGTDWVIYINGVAQTTTNIGSGSGVVSTTLLIGKSKPDSTRLHNGIIDEVRIWDEALTELPSVLVIEVEIDIKPGSDPNPINLGSKGVIPVAIFSTEDFDATTVRPETVFLGGADVAVRGKGDKYMAHEEDVDGDGFLDLVVQVATEAAGLWESGEVVLFGETTDGLSIAGFDTVVIVPPEE